jgi:CheY-like chemotaxis protein
VVVVVHIVLIEDHEPVRKTLDSILTRGGHKVWPAADGKQGMQIVDDHPIDLVITDMVMPNQDGIATIAQLKKTHPAIKVIAISGMSPMTVPVEPGRPPVDPLEAAAGLGAEGVLRKPFLSGQLLTMIRGMFYPDLTVA